MHSKRHKRFRQSNSERSTLVLTKPRMPGYVVPFLIPLTTGFVLCLGLLFACKNQSDSANSPLPGPSSAPPAATAQPQKTAPNGNAPVTPGKPVHDTSTNPTPQEQHTTSTHESNSLTPSQPQYAWQPIINEYHRLYCQMEQLGAIQNNPSHQENKMTQIRTRMEQLQTQLHQTMQTIQDSTERQAFLQAIQTMIQCP